jgi:mannose-6-phosphate isomerase-like protein (cupin superfamily)
MAASRKMATATKTRKTSKIARTAVRTSSGKTSSSKTSSRRRIVTRKSKPKAKAATKAGSKAKSAPRKQTFVASHLHANAFEGGLRSYAKYRDLGIAAATNGLAVAHVIKMIPPCDPAVVSKRHYHDVDFQMIYVLKGWIKGEYDGEIATMREGSCWLQPPKIKHTVLDYSHDCELLEIILPADFETVELET